MSEHNIEVESGKSLRLKTAGKYCDRDVVVTATGGGDTEAAYQEGLADGKQAEYDRFWDNYQDYGNRTNYEYAFSHWVGEVFKPKYNIAPIERAGYMFASATIPDLKGILEELGVTLDFSKNTDFDYTFSRTNTSRIPKVDASSCKILRNTFLYCAAEYIEEVRVVETTTYQHPFQSCSNLKDITFVGTIGNSIDFLQSKLLSNTSAQSIIDALKDLTGATAMTVTFYTTVGAKLTEAQKATITAKNWTLVY